MWFDLETTGRDATRDRILQFAARRTDLNLNPVGDAVNFLCKPPPDRLPDPEAIALTGISIAQCEAEGLSEFAFAKRILATFEAADTCIVGYNNLRFDDEFLRNLFYRNLFDPYAREWQHGRSRWDVIDTVRLCRALRPDGIVWPVDDAGAPSNRLELLSRANGLAHESAHDALSDVDATIAMANLLRERQGKLYNYAFSHRDKHSVGQLLKLHKAEPVVHISGMYGAKNHFIAVVLPLIEHPTNKNGILVADLSYSADPYRRLSAEALRDNWFGDAASHGPLDRLPVKTLHINRCPVVAPLSVLRPEDQARLGVDMDQVNVNLPSWTDTGLRDTLSRVLESPNFATPSDPELQLYSGGFFSNRDRSTMQQLVAAADDTSPIARDQTFDDHRIGVLVDRARARNWPDHISDDERVAWQAWVKASFDDAALHTVNRQDFVESVARLGRERPDTKPLMDELSAHYRDLLN